MSPTRPGPWLSSLLALFALTSASAATNAPTPDPAAISQLVSAVSLDVMSEASVEACNDIGAPSAPQVRAAWVAWREQHQLAPLRMVVTHLKAQPSRSAPAAPDWTQITGPMRERVLDDPAPEKTCAALARDFQTPAMDASALYPLARAGANAMVQTGIAWPADTLPAVTAPPGSQFLLPSQIDALHEQQKKGWDSITLDEAQRKLGYVYVKGRVQRWTRNPDRFQLIQEQGGRVSGSNIHLGFDAEAWVGREVVLRGLVTTLNWYSMKLSDAAMVIDASALKPSPLAQKPLRRPGVILKRVLAAPGKGVPDKDVEAVGIHGEANYNNGSSWSEDVIFLFRDGTAYARTSMPPDELDMAVSRKLEPGQWSRWRKAALGYELQDWDEDGRPEGDWRPIKHLPRHGWPQDTKLDGYFENASFSGSLMLGGTTRRYGIAFTRDGRFERSFGSVSGSGGMAGAAGTVVSASSRADGKGSSSSAGGTSNGATAISSSRSTDDGAGRRGRYRLSGYTLVLDFDNGQQQRLLCFPAYGDDNKTIYVGNASYSRK